MKVRYAIVGIVFCAAIGGIAAYFTTVRWLAASLWVFAAMYVNGTIAVIEDDLPGGFDNPDGLSSQQTRWGSWCKLFASLAVAGGALAAGAYVQFR